MTIIRKAKSMLKQFCADQNGTIAVMVGLSAIPLLLAAGAAVDFARYSGAQTQVQAALDAAALAGGAAKDVTDAQRIEIANATFERNFKSLGNADLAVKANFKIDGERFVSSADLEMPTSFMALGGIEMMKGTSSAEVGLAQDKKAEVVLVLDYSGSMTEYAGSEVKYIAMKRAAMALVEDLASTDPERVKFGLVPFSHQVYTTLPGEHVVGAKGATWTGCTLDRQFPYNTDTSTPSSSNETKWDPSIAPVMGQKGCGPYKTHNLKTVDLTDDFSAVTGQLAIMTPYSYTHIALGVEFGYHMLSPNAPFTTGAAFDDEKTKKFMVVLTDGDQTEHAFGPGKVRSWQRGLKNLAELCTNAKANNVTMITMAFDLGTGPTVEGLRKCASNPAENFFTPETAADLTKAFDSIKQAITAEVYLSK